MTENKQNIQEMNSNELFSKLFVLRYEGWRLIQMHCTSFTDHNEINYSFGKENEFYDIKTVFGLDDVVTSISQIFPPAFLYENEIKELFGVNIIDISIDFNGKMYIVKGEAPFKKEVPNV
jgi:ech hydrogenase subunit D